MRELQGIINVIWFEFRSFECATLNRTSADLRKATVPDLTVIYATETDLSVDLYLVAMSQSGSTFSNNLRPNKV